MRSICRTATEAGVAVVARHVLVVSGDVQARHECASLLQSCGCEVAFANPWEVIDKPALDQGFGTLICDVRGADADQANRWGRLAAQRAADRAVPATAIAIVAAQDQGRASLPPGFSAALTPSGDRKTILDALQAAAAVMLGGMGGGAVGPPWDVRIGGQSIRTWSPEFRDTLQSAGRFATLGLPVLFVGESGAGKTTLARIMHDASPRAGSPFGVLPCDTMSRETLTRELFGAWTRSPRGDARFQSGKLAAIGEGTLLLKEAPAIPRSIQAAILRLLEDGEYEPAGEARTCRTATQLWFAAATTLESLLAQNRISREFGYHLEGFSLELPPLRARRADLCELAVSIVNACRVAHGLEVRRIDPEFLVSLASYPWPGNLRELTGSLTRAALFCKNGELQHWSPTPRRPGDKPELQISESPAAVAEVKRSLAEALEASEVNLIRHALAAHGFQRTATARALGVSRVGLYKKMKRLGLLDLSPHDAGPQKSLKKSPS